MKNTVLNWIKENNMVNPGDHVICAVSGGVDSMCLVHVLNSLKDKLGITVSVANFNHCIRGDESDMDSRFVEKYCDDNGIDVALGIADVPGYAKQNNQSMEEAARNLRYDFLFSVANKYKNCKIATGHHADDNLETVIINMVHGTSPIGLAGIPPVRDNIIRPLLSCTRDEIVKYASKNGINHVEDSTNQCCDYLRNRVRHNILPLLRKENGNVAKSMVRTSAMLREDNNELSKNIDCVINSALTCSGGYSINELKKLKVSILRRVVAQILCSKGIDIIAANVIDTIKCIKSDKSYMIIDLQNGFNVVKDGNVIYVIKSKDISGINEIKVNQENTYVPESKTMVRVYKTTVNKVSIKEKQPYHHKKLYINADKLGESLVIRSIKKGDKIKTPGGTKPLTRVFHENGVGKIDQINWPVICCGDTIVAVTNLCINENYQVENPDNVLCIEVIGF